MYTAAYTRTGGVLPYVYTVIYSGRGISAYARYSSIQQQVR